MIPGHGRDRAFLGTARQNMPGLEPMEAAINMGKGEPQIDEIDEKFQGFGAFLPRKGDANVV